MTDLAPSLGRLGVIADLGVAAIIAAFVAGNPSDSLDEIPRPIALLALYAAPGLVAACGVAGRRRSFVAASAIALVPGSVLSMAGVTLVFVLPMVLFAASAASMGRQGPGLIVELSEVFVATALLIGAGVALLSLTSAGCSPSGSVCGSGNLTARGFVVELVLQALAVGVAAWRALGVRRSA